METRARAKTAEGSSSVCPACGKPIDALRAGQVAILDGAFRYFCDASCKDAYVDALSKRPSLDAMTADPPPVASSDVRTPPGSDRASADASIDDASADVADDGDHAPADRADAPSPIPSSVRAASSAAPSFPEPERPPSSDDGERRVEEGVDEAPVAVESPSTLRSPSTSDDEEAAAPASAPRPARIEAAAQAPDVSLAPDRPAELTTVGPIAGVFAGVLASVVSLVGDPAAMLRLPLALIAGAIFVAVKLLGPRSHAEPARWVVLWPVVGAMIVASVSAFFHAPHADAHASFVGLAAAAALTVDMLFVRARRDVVSARAQTSRALSVSARIVRGDEVVEADASAVMPGEQVIVEAGETVPVDGVIIAATEAEVAPWLSSSALVQKREGDAVVAGAVVASGRLRINATFCGAERAWLRLSQPSAASSDSSGHAPARAIEVNAPLVAFVRRAVERSAPVAAVLVAGAVYADNGAWLDVAIAAAGGGYALATISAATAAALAHTRGHVAAQRRGIVYKDAEAFDAAARADVAVVCSRGTILLGEPEIVVVEAITKDGVSPKGWLRSPTPSLAERLGGPPDGASDKSDIARVLAIAAGAEMSSTHPFAAAISREARARGVRPDNMRSARGHSGLGVTALAVNGERVIVGSRAFLLQEKVSVALADSRTSELEAQGRSVLLVAIGGRLVGLLALQDGLRPGARAAIQRLHDARIEPVLLSGEARDTCETIARALDIEHVRPEVLPADRGAEVRALADGGRTVAALGHAATDDGVLGAANVPVAMEAAGSAPGEWAVALASDDVRDAALALTIPRASRDRARIAVVVGGLGQALGAFGIAFGILPPALVPVLGALAAAGAVAIVREPTLTSG